MTRLRWFYDTDPDLNRVLNALAERAIADLRAERADARRTEQAAADARTRDLLADRPAT